MSKKYDLHLSAYSITPKTIITVESLCFRRDKFANNRHCDTTAYHATYRGDSRLPNDELWQNLKMILTQDSSFVGGLEEEEYAQEEVAYFSALNTSKCTPMPLDKLPFHRPTPREYKACDIHLNVTLIESSATALDHISSVGFASFDRSESDGDHRIFSATCASLEGGKNLFRFLSAFLKTVPGLKAQMKFEHTTRHIRIPLDAPALPILSDSELENWLRRHATQINT